MRLHLVLRVFGSGRPGGCLPGVSPRGWRGRGTGPGAVLVGLFLLLGASPTRGERLPVREFTPEDGLPSEGINAVLPDHEGYLWVGCDEGLSRFDGHRFRNYGAQDGLPSSRVTRLLETRAGTYWIGTASGLCRFDPDGGLDPGRAVDLAARGAVPPAWKRFECAWPGDAPRSSGIRSLAEEPPGRLWIGTTDGLFALEDDHPSQARPIALPVQGPRGNLQVNGLVGDGDGGLWIGTDAGLVHRMPDGRLQRHEISTGRADQAVRGLLRDRSGRIWVGMDSALYVFRPRNGEGRAMQEPPDDPVAPAASGLRLPDLPGQGVLLTTQDGLPSGRFRAMLEDRDGHVWLGAYGLAEFDGARLRTFGQLHGLNDPTVLGLAQDLWGNLWIATEAGGLLRLYPDGFTTYGVEDGLGGDRIAAIFESRRGELHVDSGPAEQMRLNRLEEGRFVSTRANLPAGLRHGSWGWNQLTVQDRDGDWWVPTGEGLVRFPAAARADALATARPRAWYRVGDGLPADEIFRLFEDSRGDLWVGTVTPFRPTLGRWERATGRFHIHDLREDPGGFAAEAPTVFREDPAGNLWIGFGAGGLLRYREGRFEPFVPGVGVPEGRVTDLHVDQQGALWVATWRGGAAVYDDPAAPAPTFRSYTTDDGLLSDRVNCLTEDRWGRIYLGTAQGINRLDPATGVMRRFTTQEGLARDNVTVAHRDARGDLWFGTLRGLSRLRPRPDPPEPPLVIRITDLSIGGAPVPLPDRGLGEIRGVRIEPDAAQLQIAFAAPGFAPGEAVRYQYRLGGSDARWGEPFAERSVQLGGLAPGSYRFEVRASTVGGVESGSASVSFVVLPPLWRRGWFVVLVATVLAGALIGLHRMRVRRLLALELQRTRIAMDLHDELGSGLGSIAVLADLAATESMDVGHRRGMVRQIEDTAIEMIHALSDIVRSLRPGSTTLESLAHDLAQRGRRMFPGNGAVLTIEYPSPWPQAALSPPVHRNVLLVGTEALNNAARHSGARNVVLELRPEGRRWRLGIRDDGRGMGDARAGEGSGGLGQESMSRRAREIGATLRCGRSPAGGTEVSLLFDLAADPRTPRNP